MALVVSFGAQKLLILVKSDLSIYLSIFFLLLSVLLVSCPRNHCQSHCHEDFPPVFSSNSLTVSAFKVSL